MKISYNWLKEYLPDDNVFNRYINDVHQLSDILTSVGLEVEGLELYESVRGGLEGLVVAEVVTCEKHPNADRLKVTTVNTGESIYQVVCGAPNVAAGQKVIVALPDTMLYPTGGEPFKIKKAKIRGVESNGMICAEDEIGLGESHEGIIVLDASATTGTPASSIFHVYKDYIIEIGLTPNRMDGQSHLGVAKDVCAWLSHHTGKKAVVKSPLGKPFSPDTEKNDFKVEVKSSTLARRYSGLVISDIKLAPSPEWMQNKLKVLGLKPINNIVDITNFILHATGQPLHAFDADKITDRYIIVQQLPADTPFVTLDEKERKLSAEDIIICDGTDVPMCIGGVFGGLDSGVTGNTKNIFLESAVFNPVLIRKTMIRHELRTDAAQRFEKGVDISKTVEVLKYAAMLIRDICGGKITSSVTDVFDKPADRIIKLKYGYLKKLSGREFDHAQVAGVLESLGFEIMKTGEADITVKAPESNPDISLPADVVEEILRISGYDKIPVPHRVTMTPGLDEYADEFLLSEKVASWLTGNGFAEIFTNSITNEKYLENPDIAVKILNSLTEELTVLRTEMLPTGLEAIEHNINRQNKDLLFFEFGKTYNDKGDKYTEKNHLMVLCTGQIATKSWNRKAEGSGIFYMKGIAVALLSLAGIASEEGIDGNGKIVFFYNKSSVAIIEEVSSKKLQDFGIKQSVFSLDINWDLFVQGARKVKTVYQPLSKFPIVTRDLSMLLDKKVAYNSIKELVHNLGIKKLLDINMFDLYESDKLGNNKKSIALSFSFGDNQKTLTDKETDKMMAQIVKAIETTYQAEIRSHA